MSDEEMDNNVYPLPPLDGEGAQEGQGSLCEHEIQKAVSALCLYVQRACGSPVTVSMHIFHLADGRKIMLSPLISPADVVWMLECCKAEVVMSHGGPNVSSD